MSELNSENIFFTNEVDDLDFIKKLPERKFNSP